MNAKGSCLCGKIRYEVSTTSDDIDHCHCTFCQKYHGAAFGTYIEPVPADKFTWTEGKELVARYQSSSHSARLFCSVCGSALVAQRSAGRNRRGRGRARMFWQSKASVRTAAIPKVYGEAYNSG